MAQALHKDDGQDSVLISQCGGFHARPAAEAAAAAGLLHKFIATHPQGTQIAPDKLCDLFFTVQPLRACSLLNRLSGSALFSPVSAFFDRMQKKYFNFKVERALHEKIKIFHAYSCYQEQAFARCEQLGIYKIIEHGTAHPLFDAEIIGDEFARMGVENSPYRDREWMERMSAEHEMVDRVYVISEFARRTFEKHSNAYPNVRVNPLGVDTDFFAPLQEFAAHKQNQARPFEIMTGGFVCLRKGTHYLLEAVKNLKSRHLPCRLSLLGAPLDFGNILARYAGVFDHLGGVGGQELTQWYNRADVFVLPSLSEGFGRVVTEAMACGTPCIVSENTGAAEIITDGVDGFIVPVRNSAAIEEKLELLYNDRDLTLEMGRCARLAALKNNWNSYRQRLVADYLEILSGEDK